MSPRPDVDIPLCVDLDGTLVRTDTLIESVLAAVRHRLWHLFLIPVWLSRGLPYAKRRLHSLQPVNVELLPYNQDVLEVVTREHSRGRRTVLVTASTQELADTVAAHLECFDEAHGTTAASNLKGKVKAEFLSRRFGHGGFDYIGDSLADIPVWRHARTAITVNAPAARATGRPIELLPETHLQSNSVAVYAKTVRVHQWVKNLLVLVPLLTSHSLLNSSSLAKSLVALFALCCLASSSYIVNDLLDIDSDRRHLTKRSRPIPSGQISLRTALALGSFLFIAGVAAAWNDSPATLALCLLYFFCSVSYSLFFKRRLLVDTIMLAGLYTIRVLIGGVAAGIPVSFWLLAFSIFVFFSLALVKRVAELVASSAGPLLPGRGYQRGDIQVLTDLGVSSAFVATAVFALYLNSREVQLLYADPKALWVICPVFLYWFSRIWVLTLRGKMHDDPIIFVFKDRICYLLAAIALTSIVVAKFGNLTRLVGESLAKYITF